MKRLSLLIPAVSVLLSTSSWGGMYRWVDDDGVVTYKACIYVGLIDIWA